LCLPVGREWYQGLTLQPNVGDSDVAIVHTLWNRWRIATTPSSSFNITLNLDTNQVSILCTYIPEAKHCV
jgi:hypothetical protein